MNKGIYTLKLRLAKLSALLAVFIFMAAAGASFGFCEDKATKWNDSVNYITSSKRNPFKTGRKNAWEISVEKEREIFKSSSLNSPGSDGIESSKLSFENSDTDLTGCTLCDMKRTLASSESGRLPETPEKASKGERKQATRVLHYPGHLEALYRKKPKPLPAVPTEGGKQDVFEAGKDGTSKMEITADEIRYSEGVTKAEGGAKVVYRGFTVLADVIEYHHKSGLVKADGSVIVKRGGDKISGKRLVLNLTEQQAEFYDAYGEVHDYVEEGTGQDQSLYFWGEKIIWKENIEIVKGVVTTCSVKAPDYHYHLSGDRITLIPNEKILIKKARLFFGKKQLLGLNRMRLPLKARGVAPYFPRIGRNSLEGAFVKIPMIYIFGNDISGLLNIDYYRKAGFGLGIDHSYRVKDRYLGRFKYYSMGSVKNSQERYIFSKRIYYKIPKDYWVSANYTTERYQYPGYTSPHIKNAEFLFGRKSDRVDYTFRAKDYKYGLNRHTGFNLKHRYHFDEKHYSDVILDYLSSDNTIKHEWRLNTLARFVRQGDLFDTYLEVDHTNGSRKFYVNRLPELAFRSHGIKMGPFTSKLSLAAGHFVEMPSDTRAMRSDLRFSLLNTIFPLGKSGEFAVAGGARQFVYGTGDKKYLVKSRLALEERLGKKFSVILSHHYQDTNGYSPLAFDYYDKYHVVAGTLRFTPTEKLRAQVTGGYDVDRKSYQTIIPRIEVMPTDSFRAVIGSTYDRNNRLWQNVDGELGFKVGKDVTLKYWGLYDLVNSRMSYQNYVAEFDSHDFITRLIYKGSQGELWVSVSMKFLPYDDVEVGPHPNMPIIEPKHFDGAPRGEEI